MQRTIFHPQNYEHFLFHDYLILKQTRLQRCLPWCGQGCSCPPNGSIRSKRHKLMRKSYHKHNKHNVGQVTTIYSLQTVSCVQCTKSSGESKQGQVEKHHTVFRTKRKNRMNREKKTLTFISLWRWRWPKNGEGKGGKHLEEENIWSTEEKKNGVGKRGNIWRWEINGDADQPTDQLYANKCDHQYNHINATQV